MSKGNNMKEAMCKADRATSELKMKHMTGTSKNYEHGQDKAERLCSGGSAGLGSGKKFYGSYSGEG